MRHNGPERRRFVTCACASNRLDKAVDRHHSRVAAASGGLALLLAPMALAAPVGPALTGIARVNGHLRAYFMDRASTQTFSLSVGQTVGDIHLVRLSQKERTAWVEIAGEPREITFDKPQSDGAAGPKPGVMAPGMMPNQPPRFPQRRLDRPSPPNLGPGRPEPFAQPHAAAAPPPPVAPTPVVAQDVPVAEPGSPGPAAPPEDGVVPAPPPAEPQPTEAPNPEAPEPPQTARLAPPTADQLYLSRYGAAAFNQLLLDRARLDIAANGYPNIK